MKRLEDGPECESCGGPSEVVSRINPQGFLISRAEGALIIYENHHYCSDCAHRLLENVLHRVQNIW